MTCAPSEDSDQPGHPPSLIIVFACAQRVAKDRAQAYLSLRLAYRSFCWFCHAQAYFVFTFPRFDGTEKASIGLKESAIKFQSLQKIRETW